MSQGSHIYMSQGSHIYMSQGSHRGLVPYLSPWRESSTVTVVNCSVTPPSPHPNTWAIRAFKLKFSAPIRQKTVQLWTWKEVALYYSRSNKGNNDPQGGSVTDRFYRLRMYRFRPLPPSLPTAAGDADQRIRLPPAGDAMQSTTR